MEKENKIIRISVRTLVEFLLRSGSLDPRTGPSSEAAMLEGARIHRMLQKKSGEGYRAEVMLRMDVPVGGAFVRLEGRADGIFFMKDTDGQPENPFASSSKKGKAKLSRRKKNDGEGTGENDALSEGLWTIDEIKTVFRGFHALEGPIEVHLAQARCYAYMYACREGLDRIRIRMTYCSQVTNEVRCFYEEMSFEALEAWFRELIRGYEPWLKLQLAFDEARRRTIRQMAFPFPYREGQYELAAGVYRTIVHEKKLFLQAPTGTGKTMAVLFPALKAIGEGKAERIFYLTAKGVTGAVAREALSLLHEKGLSVRSLVLVSKERACPCGQVDCRPETCPRADGHFDRVNDALWDLLQDAAEGSPMTAQTVAECARRHNVCPYSLSLDAAEFADVIICDYNYAFHPQARLSRFFDGRNQSILLIDEAHNLLERGRDMYSAQLSYRQVRRFRKSVKSVWPRLWKRMKNLVRVLRQLQDETAQEDRRISVLYDWTLPRTEKNPGDAVPKTTASDIAASDAAASDAAVTDAAVSDASVFDAGVSDAAAAVDPEEESLDILEGSMSVRRAELYYAAEEVRDQIQWILEQENRSAALYGNLQTDDSDGKGAESAGIPELLEFYFGLSHFCQMLRELDEHYIVYAEKDGRSGFSIHLYCADPSGHLRACMEGLTSAIFFSATFLPIQYYKGLLGGGPEDFEMYARSSFSPEQRKVVIVRDVTSRYRDRNEETYARIARSIGRIVTCRPGNYMVYFPSYAFLENVLGAFCRLCSPTLLSGEGEGRMGDEPDASAASADASGEMFVLAQKREMTDAERGSFLEAFEDVRADRHLIGFCVLGGMFGEGIDLRSDRLIGSLIVGTGIPPVEPQRELLREYFSGQGRNGYDFAYRFPGMNKVLQAAGRVIRTAEDVGIVVLMDGRFSEGSNRELFPLEWGQPESVAGEEAAERIRDFWRQYR